MNDQAALAGAEAMEAFAQLFYRRVPPADLVGRDAAALDAAAHSIWDFAQIRAHATPNLRLLPPGADGVAVVEIVNDDMPFLVDSVTATLSGLALSVQLVIHPVVMVHRDKDGVLTGLAADAGMAESFMRIEVSGLLSEARGEAVLRRLREVLDHVRVVVSDWAVIRANVQQMAADLGGPTAPSPYRAEAAAFLDWIADDNFVFLGYREYGFTRAGLRPEPGGGRGLLRDDAFLVFEGLRALSARSAEVQTFLRTPQPMIVSKSMRRAPVHRLLPMDTVGVKVFDDEGTVTGLRLVVGLFTRASYFRPPSTIPMLRQKLRRCHDRAGVAADSHDGRALARILAAFPRDELFQISEAELYETAMGLLHLEQRPRIALFVLRDPFERFVTGLVYLPAERYNSEVRARMGKILAEAFAGQVVSDSTRFDESPLARIHFVIATTPGRTVQPDIAVVERALVEAGLVWADRLTDALAGRVDKPAAEAALARFAEAFPPAYAQRFTASDAVDDIALIGQLDAGAPLAARLDILPPDTLADGSLRLKIVHADAPVVLSDMLPLLENLGVRVLNEIPFELSPHEGGKLWMQEFSLLPRDGAPAPAAARLFEVALRAIWAGEVENDGFNRLVLAAGIDVHQAVILRAYCKILRQAGTNFSQAYMEATLAAHASIARDLVALFEAQFDPGTASEARAEELATQIGLALDDVSNSDEDRILRSFLLLIRKSLRTNRYRPGRNYLSIKLASQEIDLLPLPRPLVEIHVYSPWMEGCHLRGGRVARGGLRWSDRREDFRTEILGLMKAQMVKNAVIVPVGSKGGFVVKRPPGGRAALMAEVVHCYQTLIRGLLDITDNYVGTAVIPPADVVRRDGDDPYLVVAADKGTATFSDIANALAIEYGFWLGDAFASGGSVGYDHKVMGITAKGAWEAVKRHFRELGTDIQSTPFTCIGIGDMSGDVFGNGMMLSRKTRLLAAFNHLHIFIDPHPDPERSWEERCRLFALPGSAWTDYAPAVLSKGGAVLARSAKTITLSAEAMAVFGVAQAVLTPNELISALLRQPVDLLWFGGIGTYVKASTESHADAGDRACDAIRVDAPALRAKVIGEGANLGMTQRARIEYALAGGRLNTDAIDNSAGVDTSDHEVNIKIGVGTMIESGLLPGEQRTSFLASLIGEVEHLVLADNILQTQALSLEVAEGGEALERHARLMRGLEREHRLDRAVEFLPDEKALSQRAAARTGLTRPELAVLMAYGKNALYDALLAGPVPDDAEVSDELMHYFPAAMQIPAMTGHRLRREIIATVLANELINRLGITFVADLMEATGADVAGITRAFLIVRAVFGLPVLWAEIAALDNLVPAATQLALLREVTAAAEQAISWFLTSGVTLEIAARRAEFGAGFTTLAASLSPPASQWEGVPAPLAGRVANLSVLVTSMDIVQIAEASGTGVPEAGAVYFTVGDTLGLARLRSQARLLPGGTPWARIARDALIQDSYAVQRRLAQSVVAGGGGIEAWLQPRTAAMTGIEAGLMDMARSVRPDLALLGVVIRRIAALG
jgi:glutamate dehydrogenase